MSRTVQKVLLVDDHEMYLKYWTREFARAGVSVCNATTKASALAAARQEQPDLAMVDLFLTPPETGIDVIRALKEELPGTFCILVSAHLSVAHALLGVRAGADDVFFKPFGAKQAIARVEHGTLQRPEEPTPTLSQIEWEHIARALQDHGGNISAAAESLGVFRQSLQRKILKHAPRVLTDDPLDYRKLPEVPEVAVAKEEDDVASETPARRKRKPTAAPAKPIKRRRH
ncbi:MAG TPA: response regulator [Kofleriaceae bacterium]|nr:response regulator [Kofleriaceae bacterium]